MVSMGSQSGIAEVLRRTIVAVCEVNVSFGANLEILGSVHIRSDDAKFASFMLEEQVFRDHCGTQTPRKAAINVTSPSTINRQTQGSSNPKLIPAKGSTNSTSAQENNTIIIEPTGTNFMDIEPGPKDAGVQVASLPKGKPDIYVDLVSRAESSTGSGTSGNGGYESNVPILQDIPVPLEEPPGTDVGNVRSKSAKQHSQTLPDPRSPSNHPESDVTAPGYSKDMPAGKKTPASVTNTAGSSADLPLIIKDEDLEECASDVEVLNINRDPKQRLLEKMIARTRAAVTRGNKRSFVFHHFKMPHSKQQKHGKKEVESTGGVEGKTDVDTNDDQVTIDEKEGDSQGARSQPVKCPKCGVILYNKYNLRRHMNSAHTKEKEFACEVCGKTFYSDNTLCKHRIRTHNIMGKRRRFREAVMMHHLAAMHHSPAWDDPQHMAMMEEHMKHFSGHGGYRGCRREGHGFGRGGRGGFPWRGGFGRGGFGGWGHSNSPQCHSPPNQKNYESKHGPSEENESEFEESHQSHDPKDQPHSYVQHSQPHTQTTEQSNQLAVSEKAQNNENSINVKSKEGPQNSESCVQIHSNTNRAAETVDLAALQQAAEHLVSLQGTSADQLQQSDSKSDKAC